MVIPAHNETCVITRCPDALFEEMQAGGIDVVGVCNRCTDGTAEKARSSRSGVGLIELEMTSKPAALRAGDAAALRYAPE